ncbi:MAG: SusC/RagA family TonB-linked outer membrane protein, partial [Bacteroidaceae bacterium]|nr:SusC/RagA family TonB-linked outer membrane protein [Bacteroidaceae bacterium]
PWTEFLRWDNGMRDVSKLGHRWSEETIKAYENGDPDAVYFDWYNEFAKKVSVAQQYNANIRGGSEQVQYYFGLGYAKDDSIFKTNAYNYDRYNLNGNITAKMGQSFTVNFQTTMRITNTKQPGSYNDLGNVSYYAYQSDPTTRPWVASGSGHLTSVAEHKNIAAILDPQYELTDRRNMNFNNTLDLTYDAPFLKGFKIQATGAFDYGMSKSSVTLRHWDEYDYKTDTFVAHGAGNGMNFKQVDQYYEDWMYNTRIYGRIQANYQTRVNQHDIQAMIAAETTVNKRNSVTGYRAYGSSMDDAFFTHPVLSQGDATTQTNTGTRTSNATAGYLARLNYNYGGRYFAEVMARVDGTYNYAPGKRWGVFPSYSLGWRISEENFVKNNAPWLNNLKIRWSDGWTGQVQGSAYAYLLGYTTSGSWSYANGANTTGYANSSNAETLLSWSKARMMDAGIDWELWRGKFGGSFDWFSRNISGIAAKRSASLPDFYGVSLPSENLDKSQNMGLELMLYHRNTVGEFSYRIQATATFARSRTTYSESAKTAKYTSAYNKWANDAVGRWSGYNSGSIYHTNGQFANLNQIADANVMYNRTTGNYTLSPGQYSVVDRNGNGYWDSSDVYYVFNNESNPPLQYGLQFSGNWRKFDLSLVFSGSALRWKQVSMSGYAGTGFFYYMPKQYTDSYHVANYGDDPWDPNTQWVSGYYPALQAATTVGQANTGVYNSNLPYNYINAAFMRLKTLDLGYTISSKGMAAAGIKGLRVSFNATNLFTICDKRLKYVDPETQDNGENGGTLPPNKGYTFGVRLTF